MSSSMAAAALAPRGLGGPCPLHMAEDKLQQFGSEGQIKTTTRTFLFHDPITAPAVLLCAHMYLHLDLAYSHSFTTHTTT
jgi:hypothetical protein